MRKKNSYKLKKKNLFLHTGVGQIFDRVLSELIKKMREMRMDKTELGCLRAIVLYNPGNLLYIKL